MIIIIPINFTIIKILIVMVLAFTVVMFGCQVINLIISAQDLEPRLEIKIVGLAPIMVGTTVGVIMDGITDGITDGTTDGDIIADGDIITVGIMDGDIITVGITEVGDILTDKIQIVIMLQ